MHVCECKRLPMWTDVRMSIRSSLTWLQGTDSVPSAIAPGMTGESHSHPLAHGKTGDWRLFMQPMTSHDSISRTLPKPCQNAGSMNVTTCPLAASGGLDSQYLSRVSTVHRTETAHLCHLVPQKKRRWAGSSHCCTRHRWWLVKRMSLTRLDVNEHRRSTGHGAHVLGGPMNGPNGQKRIVRTPQTTCMIGGRFSLCEQTWGAG